MICEDTAEWQSGQSATHRLTVRKKLCICGIHPKEGEVPRRAGGIITKTHASVTPDAGRVVDAAVKLAAVTKISISVRKGGISSGRRRLKFKQIQSGLEVHVVGTTSVQVLYIYTKEPQAVQLALEKSFEQ